MRRLFVVAAVSVVALLAFAGVKAQTRYSYSSGQSISPAYEGWWENDDGSFTMFFGYMNTNWAQEFDIPVGADNNIEPGGPDQGQPTHFYPRRNPFLFTIRVPKDFGKKELVWTVTANGQSERPTHRSTRTTPSTSRSFRPKSVAILEAFATPCARTSHQS